MSAGAWKNYCAAKQRQSTSELLLVLWQHPEDIMCTEVAWGGGKRVFTSFSWFPPLLLTCPSPPGCCPTSFSFWLGEEPSFSISMEIPMYLRESFGLQLEEETEQIHNLFSYLLIFLSINLFPCFMLCHVGPPNASFII